MGQFERVSGAVSSAPFLLAGWRGSNAALHARVALAGGRHLGYDGGSQAACLPSLPSLRPTLQTCLPEQQQEADCLVASRDAQQQKAMNTTKKTQGERPICCRLKAGGTCAAAVQWRLHGGHKRPLHGRPLAGEGMYGCTHWHNTHCIEGKQPSCKHGAAARCQHQPLHPYALLAPPSCARFAHAGSVHRGRHTAGPAETRQENEWE